ncbi:hypothetical protein ALQ69_03747 [Pseudomonas savastanoi pv. glycinea]|nr:hypothetical protein ALQ69_03747 [Pseudomonas savastanoi pv. glycinea]
MRLELFCPKSGKPGYGICDARLVTVSGQQNQPIRFQIPAETGIPGYYSSRRHRLTEYQGIGNFYIYLGGKFRVSSDFSHHRAELC